jgi:hypothetical protein
MTLPLSPLEARASLRSAAGPAPAAAAAAACAMSVAQAARGAQAAATDAGHAGAGAGAGAAGRAPGRRRRGPQAGLQHKIDEARGRAEAAAAASRAAGRAAEAEERLRLAEPDGATPGPGAYEVPPVLGGKAFLLGHKHRPLIDPHADEPGSGHYDPRAGEARTMPSSPQVSIGSGTRDDYLKVYFGQPRDALPTDTPGPGQYRPEDSTLGGVGALRHGGVISPEGAHGRSSPRSEDPRGPYHIESADAIVYQPSQTPAFGSAGRSEFHKLYLGSAELSRHALASEAAGAGAGAGAPPPGEPPPLLSTFLHPLFRAPAPSIAGRVDSVHVDRPQPRTVHLAKPQRAARLPTYYWVDPDFDKRKAEERKQEQIKAQPHNTDHAVVPHHGGFSFAPARVRLKPRTPETPGPIYAVPGSIGEGAPTGPSFSKAPRLTLGEARAEAPGGARPGASRSGSASPLAPLAPANALRKATLTSAAGFELTAHFFHGLDPHDELVYEDY